MRFPASVDRFPCFHTCPAYEQKKRAIPGRIFLIAIYIPMVPSAERRAHPFPPVEMLLPASVDRFPCFHTCPAYEQKKRAIPGRIFLIAIYIPMVPSAERRHRAGIFCSHRSAKTPNPDDPIPNFVRGRESTWLTFVLENPPHWAPVIFAMEQS